MKKVEVVGLHKNNIVHKNMKHKLRKQLIFSVVFFCFLMFSLLYGSYVNSSLSEVCKDVFSPIAELYNSDNSATFVNASNYYVKDKKFIVPIRTSLVENVNGIIHFTVQESIMVYAPASGIVAEEGTTSSGKRYIKIKHSDTCHSVIENVDVVGVCVGDGVKQGKEIATAKTDSVVVLLYMKMKILLQV